MYDFAGYHAGAQRKMNKKRIFATVLASGMIAAQGSAFAKVLSDQDFTAGEGYESKSNNATIWGGWSTIQKYSSNKVRIADGRMEMFRSLATPGTSTTPQAAVFERDITGVTEDDDQLVIEFDWYRLRYEIATDDEAGTEGFYIVEDTEPVMLPPLGDKGDQWNCGFGVYYKNTSDVDIPLFFMSPLPFNYDNASDWTDNQRMTLSTGTEAPTETAPTTSRPRIYPSGIPDLTTADNYRYRLVIELNENEAGKYPYELYLKAGNEDWFNLTGRSAYDAYALTYNEIPTKIRIGARLKTGSKFIYDFDGDGVATTFCDKNIVDNYLCYTIDTDETVSKVTYLDGCGNLTDEITAGETYTASVTYNNETESTLPLTMITGFYDADDYFYDSIEEAVSVPTGWGALKGAANVFNISGGDFVKGFAWSDLDNMIPYADFDAIPAEAAPAVDEEVAE